MKNLLILGCSYSALYYHPDPRWSYTWLLKEAVGAKNLINLAFGGNSPSGCSRSLEWYLRNPIKGLPDLIYVQVPNGVREEYYLSASMWDPLQECTFVNTNEAYFKADGFNDSSTGMPNARNDLAWNDYEKFRRPDDTNFASNDELVKDIPWNELAIVGGTLWDKKDTFNSKWLEHYMSEHFSEWFYVTSSRVMNVNASWGNARTNDSPSRKNIITDFHKHFISHKKPMQSSLMAARREMAVMQQMVKPLNIPIVFNSTDNLFPDMPKKLEPQVTSDFEFETWDDVHTHYDALINWNNVIKYESMNNRSKTSADIYWDGHPGRQSHENYFNAIWRQVKSLLP